MGDRAAKWALALAPLYIDMNPLMVAGDIGESIDFFLVHFDRLAPGAKLSADFRLQPLNIVEPNRFHWEPPFGLCCQDLVPCNFWHEQLVQRCLKVVTRT